MNIVTGGAGFIGSHLAEALYHNEDVLVVDDMSFGNPDNIFGDFLQKDVVDLVPSDVDTNKVEYIYHLAAKSDIVPSIDNPRLYLWSNVVGTINLLEFARACPNLKCFVYAASSSCYGIPEIVPTPENTKIDTRYPYSFSKWSAEQTILHYGQVYGLPVVSLRLFNVYGPRVRSGSTYGAMFATWLSQISHGLPITIVGDGSQKRDFIYVSDVVSAFYKAAHTDWTGYDNVLNVGTGSPVSVKYIADRMCPNNQIHLPKRPGEPDVTHASIMKTKLMLGWEPTVMIDEGIQIMLDHTSDYANAPQWTKDRINEATKNWFRYLK